MPNSNNNTTPLSSGTLGTRNFSNYTARQISSEISRNNYRTVVVSDQRMQKFRNSVFKMVSKWGRYDKLNILTEYGDISSVGNNPSDDVLNRALTESIIIHLEPNELEQLYKDIIIETESLKKDIKKLNTRPKTNFSLNMKTFEAVNKQIKNSQTTKDYIKNRNAALGNNFKVPKQIQSQYRNLRGELYDVLKTCFNVVEISSIAFSMGINIGDGMPNNKLRDQIVNKTLLYVDLIVGNNKNTSKLAGAFMDPAPYENLLQYTSYSYVTGNPNIDPTTWKQKKDAARKAKAAIKERSRMRNSRVWTSSNDFRDVAGIKTSNLSQAGRILDKKDTGILSNASFDELVELAGKYGVNPNLMKGSNTGRLKAEIYSAMAAETKRIKALTKAESNSKSFKDRRHLNDLLSVHNISGRGSEIVESGGGSDIPVVQFKSDGTLASTSILEAVPVYIIGQGGRGDSKKNGTYVSTNGGPILNGFGTRAGGIAQYGAKNINSAGDLSKKDLETYQWLMSLEPPRDSKGNEIEADCGPNDINAVKGGKTPTTLRELDAIFKENIEINRTKLWVDYEDFKKFRRAAMNMGIKQNAIYAQVYAYGSNMKKLADSISKAHGIPKTNVIKMFRKGVHGVGTGILKYGVGGLALAGALYTGNIVAVAGVVGAQLLFHGIRGIVRGITARMKYGSGNFEDLPQRDKDFYTDLDRQNISTLINIACGRYGLDLSLVTKFLTSGIINPTTKNPATSVTELTSYGTSEEKRSKKNGLIAIIAAAAGMNLTVTYCEKNMAPTDVKSKEYQKLKKGDGPEGGRSRNIFRKTASFFKSIGNFFTKHNAFKGSLSEGFEADPLEGEGGTETTLDDNDMGLGPIPVIKFKQMKLDDISRAIPVFIVNGLVKGGLGLMATDTKIDISGDAVGNVGVFHDSVGGNAGAGNNVGPGNNTFTGNFDYSSRDNSISVLGNGPAENKKGKKTKNAVSLVSGVSGVDSSLLGFNLDDMDGRSFQLRKGRTKKKPNNADMNTESERLIPKNREINDEGGIKPVFVVNSALGANEGILAALYQIDSSINDNFTALLTGLSGTTTQLITAPYGVGQATSINPSMVAASVKLGISNAAIDIAKSTLKSVGEKFGAMNTGGTVSRAHTGAAIRRRNIARFQSGGTSIITGDAAGNDIFAHGAKPELVQSNGDMIVTPLNKMGTQNNQRISRMTTTERKAALATGISSHIVRYAYKLPADATDLTDTGEAIKVFNVKPGVTDPIIINGAETTLAELVAGIYAQLTALTTEGAAATQLLGAIAGNTAAPKISNKSVSANPFTGGFPDSLDGITGGN